MFRMRHSASERELGPAYGATHRQTLQISGRVADQRLFLQRHATTSKRCQWHAERIRSTRRRRCHLSGGRLHDMDSCRPSTLASAQTVLVRAPPHPPPPIPSRTLGQCLTMQLYRRDFENIVARSAAKIGHSSAPKPSQAGSATGTSASISWPGRKLLEPCPYRSHFMLGSTNPVNIGIVGNALAISKSDSRDH